MMPDGWELRALGRDLKVQGGFAFKSEEFCENGIPIVRISSIREPAVVLDDAPCYEEDKKLSRFLLRDGDILIAMSGATTGKIGRFSSTEMFPQAYLNQRVGRFKLSSDTLDADFTWHLISTSRFRHMVNIEAIGGAQPNVSGSEIETLAFSIPPLPEQKKIAEILSTWDRAIETAETLLATARTQKRALMQTLLTGKRRFPEFEGQEWREVRMDEVARIVKGKQKSKASLSDEGDYPVINGGIGPSGYTDEWNTKAGTITISEGGNSCGYVNLIHERFWSGGHCYTLDQLSARRDFLFHALKFQEDKIMSLRVGSGLPNIQKKALSAVLLNLPSEFEQQRIEEALNLAHEEEIDLGDSIEKLRTEKKALMQQLLTGKRRVQV